MNHLTPDECLTLAERGDEPADAHLERCERCRTEVAALREALRAAASVPVPEPSPLFWEHFSRRVAQETAREPVAPKDWWRKAWPLAPAAAALLAVFAISVLVSRPDIAPPADAVTTTAEPAYGAVTDLTGEAEADEAWNVVAWIAEDVDAEAVDAAGIGPGPGRVEEAALELSPAERRELIRILRLEVAETSGTEG